MVAPKMPSTVRLRRLAAGLRRLREAADLTQEQVAERTGINTATLYRAESGRARPQRRTLVSLLDLYRANEQQREELLRLFRDASNQGWLQDRRPDLPETYAILLEFESEARRIRTYETLLVPGLLQTPDYAQAALRKIPPDASESHVETRLQARLSRQARLRQRDPLHLWAVLDEAAVRRVVGGREVMMDQLSALLDAARLPNVTIQVIPFLAGAHAAAQGAFLLMDMRNLADPPVVLVESIAGDLFFDAPADVDRFNLTFEHVVAEAASPEHSLKIIEALIKSELGDR